jgi:hypothetical protein
MGRLLSFLLAGIVLSGASAGCEKKTQLPSHSAVPPRGASLQDFSDRNEAPPPPPPRKRS